MRPEHTQAVETELRRFAADLNLSDQQKTQLKTALENAHERFDDFRAKNPNITKEDAVTKLKEVRVTTREKVVAFLTPEQLTKWDAEVTKAREFLGQRVD